MKNMMFTKAIKDEEFVEPIVYIDRDKGYKISKFIENSHTVNPKRLE